MTESEWVACADPRPMLAHLHSVGLASGRKLSLWLEAVREVYYPGLKHDRDFWLRRDPVSLADSWATERAPAFNERCPLAVRAALLREVFGNPWRPVESPVLRGAIGDGEGGVATVEGWYGNWQSVFAWDDGTIPRLARAIHDGRRFGDLPILADALEEAGCGDRQVLEHCRGYGACPLCRGQGYYHSTITRDSRVDHPCEHCNGTGRVPLGCGHVRGCWVIDLLLGQE